MSNNTFDIRDNYNIYLLSLPSNAGVNVAEESFHRRFTVVEDFESKRALIEIHLSSIDMLVSVTVNSVNKSVSSFTTAYLPGKTFTNEVSIWQSKKVQYENKGKRFFFYFYPAETQDHEGAVHITERGSKLSVL